MSSLTPEERERIEKLLADYRDDAHGWTDEEVSNEEIIRLAASYGLMALALQHALEEIDELRERLRVLSMLVLQSDLYRRDPEVRDAVDNGLAALKEIR